MHTLECNIYYRVTIHFFRRRQNGYVTQLVQLVKPEHVSDTLMMRTTLKELKEKTFKVSYSPMLEKSLEFL